MPAPLDLNRRENDLEMALRMQKLELKMERLVDDMSDLTKNLEKNTQATEAIATMWAGSKTTVGFIKGSVAFAAGCAGVWVAVSKLWGH